MGKQTRSDTNRRRRLANAFRNLYDYAVRRGHPDPRAAAERTASRLHGDGSAGERPAREAKPRRRAEPEAATTAAPAATATPEAPAEEAAVPHRLEDRTKEQLYARAQELDISGRSQMTKEELIEAIRGHR